jgi:transcriptional regulator with XRE-family HTH domain
MGHSEQYQQKPTIGACIEADLKNLGWVQQDLATPLGVTQQAVSNWVEGVSVPRGKRIKRMLKLLGPKSYVAKHYGHEVEPEVEEPVEEEPQVLEPSHKEEPVAQVPTESLERAIRDVEIATKLLTDAMAALQKALEEAKSHA